MKREYINVIDVEIKCTVDELATLLSAVDYALKSMVADGLQETAVYERMKAIESDMTKEGGLR